MKTNKLPMIFLTAWTLCSCSVFSDRKHQSDGFYTGAAIQEISVERTQDGRQFVTGLSPQFVMERFETRDAGRTIIYVALTDGDTGGLIFIDNHLWATVSRQDALAFYSCRGYVTAVQQHWAKEAARWVDTLLAVAQETHSITLHLTGKSSLRSIVEVVNDPSLSQVGSLIDLGSNPLGIFRKLSSARDTLVEHDYYQKTLQRLIGVTTGMEEKKVAEIIKPEDVSFVNGGLIMAYPRFSLEYFVSNGIVKVVQQPSFHQLSRSQAALFYLPGTKWDQCTLQGWRNAVPAQTFDVLPHTAP